MNKENLKTKHANIKYIIFVILFYIFIFQDLIQSYISVFKYFDEIFSLFAIILAGLYIIRNQKIKKETVILIIGASILMFSGICSSLKNQYQNLFVSVSDMFLVMKFFLAIYTAKLLFKDIDINMYKTKMLKNCKFITIVLLILTAINYCTNIFPYEIRYGIKSNQLFYSHPTVLAANIIFILSIYMFCNNGRITNKYVTILIIILATTLRTKAFAIIAVIYILYFLIIVKNIKITISKLLVMALLVVVLSYSQIQFYFIKHTEDARSKLLTTSFQIAKDYFPFGTGYGTYASYMSSEYYSPVYYKYELNNVFGLSEDFNLFMCDSFWPMIIGQFGVIGTIGYIIMLSEIFIIIQKMQSKNHCSYFCTLIVFMYLLISSTAESAFVHPMSIPLAMIIGFFTQSMERNENEKDNNNNTK